MHAPRSQHREGNIFNTTLHVAEKEVKDVTVGVRCSLLVHDCIADLIKPFGSFVKCEKLKKLSLSYGGGITKQRQ